MEGDGLDKDGGRGYAHSRGQGPTHSQRHGLVRDGGDYAHSRGQGLTHSQDHGLIRDGGDYAHSQGGALMHSQGYGLIRDGGDYAYSRGEGLMHIQGYGLNIEEDTGISEDEGEQQKEQMTRSNGERKEDAAGLQTERTPHIYTDGDYRRSRSRQRRSGDYDNIDSEEERRKRNRTRESRSYPSSGSSEGTLLSAKRMRRRETSKESDTNIMLDKFLSILDNFKRSDKPRLAFNVNVVPEFDPDSKEQTVLTWITKVEEIAQIYGWDDREIIHYSLPKLSGNAKSWYKGLPSMLHTWTQWKQKLIESFPCREDYAELLIEMLAKKVKYGESFEHYYYAKVNLLNRCNIYHKSAVDCILNGIEDRMVKISAQAAQFKEPEEVLKYFRTIKVGQTRDSNGSTSIRRSNERRTSTMSSRYGENSKNVSANIRCFNCNEVGHPSFKCGKPILTCTNCKRMGHEAPNCHRNKPIASKDNSQFTSKNNTAKQVSNVIVDSEVIDKYVLDIKINGMIVKCHVDLGSQCSLIRHSTATSLNLPVELRDSLPLLKGIGGNLTCPVGVSVVDVEVQGVKETIEMYVVEDYVLSYPALIGHSFTERPDIIITKTPTELLVQRLTETKIHLIVERDMEITGNVLKPILVTADTQRDCNVYVSGSLRGPEGREYYIFPGMYEIANKRSTLLVYNVSSELLHIKKGTLLTRALIKTTQESGLVFNTCSVSISDDDKVRDVNFNPKLDSDQRTQLQQVLTDYKDCFSSNLSDLGFTNVTEMVIELEDAEPVVYRPYRLPYAERLLVRDMIQEMVDNGIVRESSSPYASPIVLVQKKTGEKRLCVDYRALNRKTKKEHYPLPRVEDQLDLLSGNTMFTSLDLASGYYQIPMSEESRSKTAFVTPDGQFEYTRMPFGLVNAPSVFQRTIHKILKEAHIKYALVYMDDILIPSKDFSEGIQRLTEVLELLRKGGLTLKLSKCNFFLDTIDFLGFEVSANGIRPGSRKTDAVSKFATPKNQHELRQFLGLSGFFRRFIKGYATISSPLTDLLKKDASWMWSPTQEQAFVSIKKLLMDRPVLALYDPRAEIELHTDASKEGLAGILLQRNTKGALQPVSYFSRKTTTDERKFHSYELETLAVVASLSRFRVYLVGIPFKILTDCNALRSTLTKRDLVPRIARWWVQLQEYDCTIEYRPGTRMSHADALSRNPVETSSSELHVLDVLQVEHATDEQDWITTVQMGDDEAKKIKRILSDPDSTNVAEVHANYKLKNNRVYRIVGDELKWLVPKGVRWQILKMNHDDVGHCGFDKTLERIRKHYWFAKMRRFVKKYVTSCLECAHHKAPGGKQEGELHPIEKVSIPFHTVHADHLGPFVKSKRGNCYLLVLVDGFTKFVNIFPVKNTKSATSVRVLKEHVKYFGVPTRLITDKGTSFTSKIFRNYVQYLGTKHITNAVATPRANGQVERFNRTILDALATMSHGGDDKSWDEHVTDIQVGINTTQHKTTRKSPSELLFGFNIISRKEGIVSSIINDTLNLATSEELVDIRRDASDKIKQQQGKDATNFNKHRKTGTVYLEGDLVRVARQVPHDGKSQKLVNKYQGPYRILKILPNDRFLIEDTPMTRKNNRKYEAVVSIDKIQPWMTFSRDIESENSDDDAD